MKPVKIKFDEKELLNQRIEKGYHVRFPLNESALIVSVHKNNWFKRMIKYLFKYQMFIGIKVVHSNLIKR